MKNRKPRIIEYYMVITLIFSLILFSCGDSKEENSLLETMEFKDMTTEQKTEVLSKIIKGKREPYKLQNLNITMKLSRSPSHPVLWDGKIIDADHGLIKISTTVQGEKWNDFRSAGDYGIIYLGKDLFMIVSEKTLDSLAISVKPNYEFKYVDCEPQECLEKLGTRLKNSGSIKKINLKNDRAIIEYVKSYKEYKKLQPQSILTKDEWTNYFESGNGLEKTLVDVPVRVMKELDFVKSVKLTIPYKGKLHIIRISRKQLEHFINMDIETIRKGWNEYFIDKYVYDKKGRSSFIKKFGAVK